MTKHARITIYISKESYDKVLGIVSKTIAKTGKVYNVSRAVDDLIKSAK